MSRTRLLSDYVGNWQSVHPFLEDGTFDQVFDYKATGKMTKDKCVRFTIEKAIRTDVD